jgi:ABC-type branched-subunit amino acid transport system substrate-binding protein
MGHLATSAFTPTPTPTTSTRWVGYKESTTVYIAALFDTTGYEWGALVFNATIAMLNNRTDGWWDDIFLDIESIIMDAKCTEKAAVDNYWRLRTEWGKPLHGIVGCRCSGASAAVARIAGLENVPQVSMSATSSRLSVSNDYPSFFRLVAPDDDRGQVGAVVSLLRSFGWDRVLVIGTDTSYTKDLATQFGSAWVGYHDATDTAEAWTGETPYAHTISLPYGPGSIEDSSIRQALDGVPTDKPAQNARVILLLAHEKDAYSILELAYQIDFQPDTIWIATDGWAGRVDINQIPSLPEHPGFLGVSPYVDTSRPAYLDYTSRFVEYQQQVGIPSGDIITQLPIFGAEMVDSILSLALALSSVSPERRDEGNYTVQALHNLDVEDGVSGRLSFTAEGHSQDPQYLVSNLGYSRAGWTSIGSVGITTDSVNIDRSQICWAEQDDGNDGICIPQEPPSDKFPVPGIDDNLPTWVVVVIPIIVLLMLAFGLKYWRSKQKVSKLKTRIEAMNNIDDELAGLNLQAENTKKRQAALISQREELQDYPETWSEANETLVEVTPQDEQYWFVQNKLHESMHDGWISKVWRVQNKPLWTYYSFHKNRLAMINVDDNERSVWHGTSSLDPSIIYNDRQDGFMMQFSLQGLWVRGIYFAHKSAYSYNYSFMPGQNRTERPSIVDGEREMFLAKLLIGNEVKLPQDRSLAVPPINSKNGLKYNTVSGETAGSQVWIVYENGRAYPDYLVRYYKGKRDSKRTPFATQKEAMKSKDCSQRSSGWFSGSGMSSTFGLMEGDVEEKVVWEYQDDLSWKPIGSAAQEAIEAAYQSYVGPKQQPTYSEYKSGEWTYRLDFQTMMQTNTEHTSHTERDVRRRALDV